MKTLAHLVCFSAICVSSFALLLAPVMAEDQAKNTGILDIAPSTAVLYAEIKQPAKTLAAVEALPVVEKFYALPQVQAAYEQEEFKKAMEAVKYLEDKAGSPWRELLAASSDGGAYVIVEAFTRGAGIMIKADDVEKRNAALQAAIELVALDAENKGDENPIQKAEYNGVTTYRLGEARFATCKEWLVIINNNQLGKNLIDGIQGEADRPLSENKRFMKSLASKPADADAWAYVDLGTVRLAGLAEKVFSGKTENVVAEFLAGGISADLRKADYVTASLTVKDDGTVAAKVVLPHTSKAKEDRAYYFGSAPVLPERDDAILAVTLRRNLDQLMSAAPDVLEEKGAAELEQATGGLTTLFAGRDFHEDVISAFDADWQFLLTRQEFAEDDPDAPNLKLPAGALVGRLKDPEKVRREFKVAFQSAIGVLNVATAQQAEGRQMELNEDPVEGGRIYYGTFLPAADDAEEPQYDIYGNFSPALVLKGDQFILASTHKLAREVSAATDLKEGAERLERVNTAVSVNLDSLRKVLEDNQNQLIAQNMLEKGHGREEAEGEINLLFDLLRGFHSASMQLKETEDTLELDVKIKSQK